MKATVRECVGCEALFLGRGRAKWCSEYCRRQTLYAGRCVDCGGLTDGSNGRAAAPKRCARCDRTQNAERNRELIRLWNEGRSSTEIGVALGITPEAVRSCVNDRRRRDGLTLSLHRRRNREWWPEIERRWAQGETLVEIAEAIGTTKSNVGMTVQTMRAHGVELPRRWRRKATA